MVMMFLALSQLLTSLVDFLDSAPCVVVHFFNSASGESPCVAKNFFDSVAVVVNVEFDDQWDCCGTFGDNHL